MVEPTGNQPNGAPTPEELKEEEEIAKQELSEDAIRSQILEKYGLDESENAELIEKLTKDQLELQKNLRKAIGQKRKWRELAQKQQPETTEPQPKDPPTQKPEDIESILDKKLEEKLEQRELESLDVPDDIKPKIQRVAQINGTTIREALEDEYVKALLEKHRKDERVQKAAISNTHSAPTVQEVSDSVPSFDMSTEEGRKQWEEWKKKKMASQN